MFLQTFQARPAHRIALLCCFWLLSLSLVAPRPSAAQSGSASVRAREFWLGMYLADNKVGYTYVRIKPLRQNGRPIVETYSDSRLKLKMFGSTVEQNSTQTTQVDAQGRPLLMVVDIASQGSSLKMEARFDYATMMANCTIKAGGSLSKKSVAIPKDAPILGDTNVTLSSARPKMGQKVRQYYLDPISVSFMKATSILLRREKVKDPETGREVSAYVTEADMTQAKMTSWDGENGDPIRAEMSLGGIKIALQREPKATALSDKGALQPDKRYTPPADFAVATAIKVDKPIPSPRKTQTLEANIAGIPNRDLILSDARQEATQVQESGSGFSADYRLHVEEFSPSESASLPVTSASLQEYLAKAPFLEIDAPDIVATAKQIRGSETNLYKIATAIRDWVSEKMTPDASIGVPRSALDIFNKRRGVCRDYSTLYAALARAAGVPTRLCGGIVFAEGRFFYHAWAESHVGKWVTLDPTLHNRKDPVPYVDATHIKFAQGDVMQMFQVTQIVGKLQIKVKQTTP